MCCITRYILELFTLFLSNFVLWAVQVYILHLSKFTRARTPASVLLAPPNYGVTSRGPDCRVLTRCAGAAQRRIAMLHSNYSPETTRCGKGTKIANRIKFDRVTMDNCTSLTLPASFLFNLESYSSCSSLHVIPALAQLYLLVPLVRLLWVSFFSYRLSLLSLLLLFFHVPCLLQSLTKVVRTFLQPRSTLLCPLQSRIYTPPIDPVWRIHSRLYTFKHNVLAASACTNQQSLLELFSNIVTLTLPMIA